MNLEKMQDLRRIATDGGIPINLRMQAAAKYEQELDQAVREFQVYLEKSKTRDEHASDRLK